ncbi:MAG: ABC transporter [Streptosporangiales bacterium]|nr:ABC transporter [Streptosporangiales bacterium]
MSVSAANASHAFECYIQQYRRTWRGSVFSTFLMPLVYLGAMGVGVGTLIDDPGVTGSLGGSYLDFLAPGLLAASVLLVVIGECTWPVISQIKWDKTFYAMLATPLSSTDVLVGHLAWVGVRAAMTAAATYLAMLVFGVVDHALSLLTLPAAILTGLALATPIYAFAVTRKNEASFSLLYRFGSVPLFLFSGTFFPVTELPTAVQPLAYVSPLWHGVDLCRTLVAGGTTLPMALLHVGYLAGWMVVGFVLARRGFARRMVV